MPSMGALAARIPLLTRPSAPLATSHPSWRATSALPIAAIGFVAVVASFVAPTIGSRTVFEILLFPVLLVALLRGVRAGLAGLAAAALLTTLARPLLGPIWIADPSHLHELAVFIADGIGFTLIGGLVRSATRALASPNRSPDASLPGRGATPEPSRSAEGIGPLRVERLTRREAEVLQLAAAGRSVGELAGELAISPNTVKTHLAHCYDKLGAHNRAEAVALAVHFGSLGTEHLEAALPANDV